ncbi:MAG: 4-oxalocrotonate tautomerase [Rhizobacter sp.]
MLRWHGLLGNEAMTPNVVGSINVVAEEHTFSGHKAMPVVFVEWKVPSFAFSSREVQLGYVEEATNIVHEASGRRQPKEHIWVNVVHAVDGAWGVAGKALTNAELLDGVAKG